VVSPTNPPRTRNVRFFAIMAFFVASGALLVFLGNHYRGKFGQAIGQVVASPGRTPVAAAKVKIVGAFDSKYGSSNTSIKIERSALSDELGTFQLRETVAGKYVLSVECVGFKRFEQPIEIGLQEHKDLGVIELEPLR
jgi:Carboxypeptidase regulatory-like domain